MEKLEAFKRINMFFMLKLPIKAQKTIKANAEISHEGLKNLVFENQKGTLKCPKKGEILEKRYLNI